MNKRVFLAIALSFLVLFSWQAIVSKFYPSENKNVKLNSLDKKEPAFSENSLSPSLSSPASFTAPPAIAEPVTLDKFETDKLKLEFINPGARIYRVYLKDYKLNSEITGGLYSKLFESETYTLVKSKDKTETKVNKNGHYLIQRLNFHNNSYYIELETIYGNETSLNWTFNDKLILNQVSQNVKAEEKNLFEVIFLGQNSQRKNPTSIKDKYVPIEKVESLAFRDRYSTIIIHPENLSKTAPYIEKQNGLFDIGFNLENITVPANDQISYKSLVYCGPQDSNLLRQSKLGFEEVVYYGSFDFISTSLLGILNFFHKLSHSWGVALILLSLFIFIVLYPLTIKQMRSMKQMQELQPQIEALRKNYKDNPQRLNKEIMELYRKHKANPVGGCLPMLLQIPIFFGLYQALSRSIVLKGSQFLWIKDLAEPDKLFILPQELPFIGREINLLPILMAIGMFFQQKLTMKTSAATSVAQEQQKMMVVIFPIMFGFIFYHFPSGLALYWFLNTLTSIFSQWKILKTTALVPVS